MPFSLLSDTVFNHPAYGLDAMYYAGGTGSGVAVKYLDVDTDQDVSILGHDFDGGGKRIKVRKADLPIVQGGDVFEITGKKHYVKGEPESVRWEWLIEFGG
ncbi:MAG: hypothetical protein COB49_00520 [Alphaproteobacteria bacterium]|nr:MAG: hypothetical protein COB49_00520 [Alphaproteobacteria bacterium]